MLSLDGQLAQWAEGDNRTTLNKDKERGGNISMRENKNGMFWDR
jgi:hypothetical protein